MKKITIQIISDIHLEHHITHPNIKPIAKYLFLAGDIGIINLTHCCKIKKFFNYCSENWEKIYYVLGNHEFYQINKNTKSFENLINDYTHLCNEYPNIYLLNNSQQQILPGLNVYGTTLWTGNYNFPHNISPSRYLNDYNMIKINSHSFPNLTIPLNENFINELSKNQLNLLEKYLKNINLTNTKTIVITHFPLLRQNTSNPKYLSQPDYLANYFSWNNIFNKLNCSNVIGWISGHTHWSYDITLNNNRFIANQYGYKNKLVNEKTNFKQDFIFELEY